MKNNEPQKNPLNGKKIALFILYIIIALLLFFTVLSMNDLPAIGKQLQSVDFRYILLALLMVLLYLATYPISLCILTKARKCNIKMSTTYTIAMTEHFFNGITPLATGGQPFQAHAFSKSKIKISESTGLLLTNLIIYMFVTTGFSFLGLFFFDTLTSSADPWWIPIIIAGYVLNFLMCLLIASLGASSRIRNGLVRFICFLCKFRIFKWLRPKVEGIKTYFEQVQAAFDDLLKKKKQFVIAVISKIISFAFLYSSSFFILLSMDIPATASHHFLTLAGTSFAVTAVGFLPTPGASGGVEGSAGQVFKSIIVFIAGESILATVSAVANGVMLIWRLISYYVVMFISLMFYIGLEIYYKRRAKKRKALRAQFPDSEEFADTMDFSDTQDTQRTE
ncbi:MAG: flippase-like domain-containing protein [Clostridia bacterium]|nr:flippase-like domain-containing protein [Clostridia bacterium]